MSTNPFSQNDQSESNKRIGRPPNSPTRHPDFLQNVFTDVTAVRLRAWSASETMISPSEACRRIHDSGGMLDLMGGDRNEIAKAIASSESDRRLKKVVQLTDTGAKGQARFKTSDEGDLFATHRVEHLQSLRSRYEEAKALANRFPDLKHGWLSIARDFAGLKDMSIAEIAAILDLT
jgi:hypothetical protein